MFFPDHIFTARQFMLSPDFELYHYKNTDELHVELHHHDFYEVFIFMSGDVEYFIEGVKYKLERGDILLINGQELHRPVIKPGIPYERIVLFIRPEFIMARNTAQADLSHCFELTNKGRSHVLHPDNEMMETMNEVLSKIFGLLHSKEFGADILKELYILEFLVYLNQSFLKASKHVDSPKTSSQLIEKVIGIINSNIENELSLEFIAAELFISKFYLAHYFKQNTGVSLYRFIKYKRLLVARSMLKSGATVTVACQKSGFGDYNNFIRSFKALYGITPKKYATSAIQPNSIIE